jgi:hypothetical protein
MQTNLNINPCIHLVMIVIYGCQVLYEIFHMESDSKFYVSGMSPKKLNWFYRDSCLSLIFLILVLFKLLAIV